MTKHLIKSVKQNSIAEEMEIEAGDYLLAINNNEIEDIFDYQYLTLDEYIEVLIQKPDGEEWLLEIEKDYEDDLGIEFENSLMDEYKSCHNKCIFCFIDQMPPGMRDTLYFKDDDSRLSFLQGNYITLTNMKEKDIDRIIKFNLAPINISIHTTNPQLRCKMLNNRFAGNVLKYIDKFNDADVEMNGQIVLCKGVNDKQELVHTIIDLEKYIKNMTSVSIVPSGLTKYRDGLYPLEQFTKNDCVELIETIEYYQNMFRQKYNRNFIYASDEWYIMAGRDVPPEEHYDGYPQLENGVGMIRILVNEVQRALQEILLDNEKCSIIKSKSEEISIATGALAYPVIKELSCKIQNYFPNIKVNVYKIINNFFGENITVSGLITASDLVAQLEKQNLGKRLLLPINMLRSGEDVFLDDLTVSDVEKHLQTQVNIVKSSGYDFVDSILLGCTNKTGGNHPYELKSKNIR
ncbi:MAG: DUF512 domain-containing protein [Eubacterium sp.]